MFGRKVLAIATVAAAGFVAMPAPAQAEGHNTGNISLSAGFDITNSYYFRGIFQEDQELIFQPYVDLGFGLIDNESYTLDAYIGTWNSIHSNDATGDWYESDVYVGATLGVGDIAVDLAYISLYNPEGGTKFADEIDLSISYDDSALWGDSVPFDGLQPYVLFAFETDGGSDGVSGEGTYFEFGVAPSMVIYEAGDYPITMTVPLAVGLSLDDYYELGPNGDDETFGFFSAGVDFSVPLPFIPAEYGAWSAHAGVTILVLDDEGTGRLADASGGEPTEFIGTFGVGFEY